jgi:hypothetical protein
MKKTRIVTAGILAIFGGLSLQTHGQENWAAALDRSETDLHLRLRYEDVQQDGTESANALTLRTRLTLTSGSYRGFKLLLEMDDVTALTDVDYADGTGINSQTATIADPEGTEVNQAFLAYQNFDTVFRYGRQRILLDNQRFVGGVGWRQNEQTYDGFSVVNNGIADLTLFYAYVHNVNRIFGESAAAGDHEQQTHLLNARYEGWSAGTLVTYAYLVDNKAAPQFSSDTLGLRWLGLVNEALSYNIEYARQSEAGDNPIDYVADYALVEAAARLDRFVVTAGYEVLGSDDGNAAFATPFATLHAFQGWADKFLVTPAAGIEDAYLNVATQLSGVKLSVVYHDLSADEGSLHYGSELGFAASKLMGDVSLTLKFADYRADEFATDTRKLWLVAAATF